MATQGDMVLDYATPVLRRGPLLRRSLYCVSLPMIAVGVVLSQGPGDRLWAAVVVGIGALLLGMALPLSAK
jgi:hypothetical protein